MRTHESAHTRVHYEYLHVHLMSCREGYQDNQKRIAKGRIDAWRTYYNEAPPRSGLKRQIPAEYARQHSANG